MTNLRKRLEAMAPISKKQDPFYNCGYNDAISNFIGIIMKDAEIYYTDRGSGIVSCIAFNFIRKQEPDSISKVMFDLINDNGDSIEEFRERARKLRSDLVDK